MTTFHIGVVVPTYNRARLCLETLESVWAQTVPPDAVVVVDDGSTDDTRQTLTPFADQGRMTYVYQENQHLSAARNTGFAHLPDQIDAVLFLDSDDRLWPDALERLAATLASAPDAPLVYGRPRLVGPDGTPTGVGWGLADFDGAQVWDKLIHRNFICTVGCVLLRRAALGDADMVWDTDLRGAEDWDLWLRLTEGGAQIVRVRSPEHPVLDYRTLPDSLSRHYENTLPMEAKTLRKQQARANAQGNTVRAARIDALLRERQANMARAQAAGVPLADSLLSPRHRLLRQVIEKTGIAGLWRRVPLETRLRMRQLLGVSRWS